MSEHDWFAPAIAKSGTVGDCLDYVIDDLSARHDLIAAIKKNLWEPGRKGDVDALTALGQKVRDLENTLRFRLEMLSPQREAAWFRPLVSEKFGPFQATLLREPVFGRYEFSACGDIKERLRKCWDASSWPGGIFQNNEPSLWTHLLNLKAQWNEIMTLNVHGDLKGARLDQLPDDLPAMFASRFFQAFLLNVRNEAWGSKARLQECFQTLWTASERLWEVQQKRTAKLPPPKPPPEAEELRAEFRQRRQAAKRTPRTASESEALRFLGFNDIPSTGNLKKRYLQLAKRMHPDCQGGSEEAFKMLNKAYNHLAERLTNEQAES